MITVRNLQKKFKTFHALKGIDLNVKKGEIYGFIGQNGAGKSTTMNILAGLSLPSEGRCLVNGKDVLKIQHPSELNIGYLPEDPRFYPWMTAYEMIDYLGNGSAHHVTDNRIHEMLGWVGLSSSENRRVGGFSRGMKQRLGICSALIHDPELLILDEPSSALDPEGRSDVLQLIGELKQMGKTVLFSTHILSDVERICDTVGMIVSGTMVMEKPLEEIRKEKVPIFDIELQSPCEQNIISRLQQIDGVKDVEINLNRLSITAMDENEVSRRLMRFFADNDVALCLFELRKNNLENIFIKEVKGK
jgi:ABC-2 type transport system ATP-binding protein